MDANGELPPTGEQPQKQDWGYTRKDTLTPKDFLRRIQDKLKAKDVLSVGEAHDMNQDTSFSWILDHEKEILEAYNIYRMAQDVSKPAPPFEGLLRRDSRFLEKLAQENTSFDHVRKMHVGRLFALSILPLARLAGYTDIVLEGVDDRNPGRLLDRSTDRSGDLLRLTAAMMLGLKIHGAYSDGMFTTAADIGDAVFAKMGEVKDRNPNAKVVVYNGAVHNMTEPYKEGTKIKEGIVEYDVSEMTYAPRAIELWGDRYGAIDLINGDRLMPESQFRFMQQQASDDVITCFTHGIDQQTYVLK